MPKKYEIWLADLDPRIGAEPGKVRPVAVVQSDLLNGRLNTTMICPITTKLVRQARYLRLLLQRGEGGLTQDSEVLVSHVRAIDNNRFVHKLGALEPVRARQLDDCLRIVLDL